MKTSFFRKYLSSSVIFCLIFFTLPGLAGAAEQLPLPSFASEPVPLTSSSSGPIVENADFSQETDSWEVVTPVDSYDKPDWDRTPNEDVLGTYIEDKPGGVTPEPHYGHSIKINLVTLPRTGCSVTLRQRIIRDLKKGEILRFTVAERPRDALAHMKIFLAGEEIISVPEGETQAYVLDWTADKDYKKGVMLKLYAYAPPIGYAPGSRPGGGTFWWGKIEVGGTTSEEEKTTTESTQEGQIAFVQYKDMLFADPNIWFMNPDGSNAHQFTTDDDSSSPCWLKDGRLVFGRAHKKHPSYGSAGFPTEIWASQPDRSEEQLILKTDSYIRHIDCSPTELEIAYSQADPDGGWDIYLKERDKEAVQLTSQPKRNNDSPAFSSDGQKVLFSAQIQQDPYRSPVEAILEMNLDGSGEKVLVHDSLERYTGPQMSPKGDKIVFYCLGLESLSVGGGHWLMLANADGSESKLFISGGVDPGWSPDGKSIIFSTGDAIKIKDVAGEADSQTLIEKPLVQDPVWQLSSAGGQQPNVPSPPATASLNLGVSPDELEKMFAESTTNAPEDFMHHWQITNVTYFKGNVFRGEKMDWYIMLDSQDPQYELPVGKKVYVFFDLYDFKDTAKGLVSMIDAEGEVIEKVDVGDSPKVPRETVIKLPDVAMYPAYWPDELQTTLMFYVEGQGNVLLEHKREINIEANPDIEANCAYAMIDTGLALMFPEAFLAFKEVKDQHDFLLELQECNKDAQKNIQDQNYEALGQEVACNAALLAQDAPIVSDILEILDTLKQLLDCKTVFTEYLPDYLSGILADLAQKGIPLDALVIQSPAEAVVTLADGKRLGVDNGQVVNDLGDGGGVSVGHPTVILFKGVQPFTVNLTGLEKGTFGLTLLQARPEGKVARFDYNKVKTAPRTIVSLEVKPDGNPEKDFQLAIDKNNDGKIDSYKKPDKFEWAGATAPKAKQINLLLIWGLSIFGLIVILGGILFILLKKDIREKIVQKVKSLFSAKP